MSLTGVPDPPPDSRPDPFARLRGRGPIGLVAPIDDSFFFQDPPKVRPNLETPDPDEPPPFTPRPAA